MRSMSVVLLAVVAGAAAGCAGVDPAGLPRHFDAEPVCQLLLELLLPETKATAVTTACIGQDQQLGLIGKGIGYVISKFIKDNIVGAGSGIGLVRSASLKLGPTGLRPGAFYRTEVR